jgi:hypothetical protein
MLSAGGDMVWIFAFSRAAFTVNGGRAGPAGGAVRQVR